MIVCGWFWSRHYLHLLLWLKRFAYENNFVHSQSPQTLCPNEKYPSNGWARYTHTHTHKVIYMHMHSFLRERKKRNKKSFTYTYNHQLIFVSNFHLFSFGQLCDPTKNAKIFSALGAIGHYNRLKNVW